jgi:hypothetical protein
MASLNHKGQQLAQNISHVYHYETARAHELQNQEKVNVVGAGGAVTAAYEQLRNAAANTEEHLLLQNAIRRFYRQLFITRDANLIQRSGNELAVELTLAGYIPNDSLTKQQVETISTLAQRYYQVYEHVLRQRGLHVDRANKWALDILAVEAESVINDHSRRNAFVEFAYEQLLTQIDQKTVFGKEIDTFGAALYVAVHQALLKSDEAVVRAMLLRRYQAAPEHFEQYVQFNQQLDALFSSPAVDQLHHIVDRLGAPLRILRRMIDERTDLDTLLPHRESFLNEYEKQVTTEYENVGKRINRAIIRSVIFLIITKFLIGIAIEVPYDYWAHGSIVWIPLIVNLLFPPLYMVALRATHRLPGFANTTALIDRIDTMLYGEKIVLTRSNMAGRRYGATFSALYVLTSVIVFGAVTYGLMQLNFSFVHIVIFFFFLSAASFLGFRLSRLIRELEVVRAAQNGMTFVRDLLYLPFVVVGQWMSDKYSRVNIVTIILDMLIELPLKTILRLIRQWGAFIDDRKDRL